MNLSRRRLFQAGALTLAAAGCLPDSEWTEAPDAPWPGRDGASGVSLNGRFYVLGGWRPEVTSEVWLTIDGEAWDLLGKAPWSGRHVFGCVVHEGAIWVVGGDGTEAYHSDVWRSPDGKAWEKIAGNCPWGPRALHSAFSFGGALWVMGGQTLPQAIPGPTVHYADVWRSPDGRAWEKVLDDAPWGPRGMISGAPVLGGRMWLIGGGTYETPEFQGRVRKNDVWSSADGIAWRRDAMITPWQPRSFHSVAVFDERLWVVGGHGDPGCGTAGDMGDVWSSPDGVAWKQEPSIPPRHATTVVAHDGKLWAISGSALKPDMLFLAP